MPLLVLLALLFLSNWIFAEGLVLLPLHWFDALASLFWSCLWVVLLLGVIWFFGDD